VAFTATSGTGCDGEGEEATGSSAATPLAVRIWSAEGRPAKTTLAMELAPANQAGHSASCLPPLAREEGDDGRETRSPEAFFYGGEGYQFWNW